MIIPLLVIIYIVGNLILNYQITRSLVQILECQKKILSCIERSPSLGEEMVEGLQEIVTFLESGKPIDEWPNATVVWKVDPDKKV